AALARLSGGRLRAGIGHGMPRWLHQVGQHPQSLMTCLAEVSETVRDLLAGQEVTFDGDQVHLDAVTLVHPPHEAVPLSLGVRGPKGIELAKELGLGVILAEGSSPDYVSRVRHALGPDLPITVFTWCGIDVDDAASGFASVRPTIEAALQKPYLAQQLGALYGASSDDEAIRHLSVAGDQKSCLESLRHLAESGADHVVLQPVSGREEEQIALFGRHVIPHLAATQRV
ncbi:MAG: LLM class flavin-dependent oxidoreductase, partial [Mycobacterium sp.]